MYCVPNKQWCLPLAVVVAKQSEQLQMVMGSVPAASCTLTLQSAVIGRCHSLKARSLELELDDEKVPCQDYYGSLVVQVKRRPNLFCSHVKLFHLFSNPMRSQFTRRYRFL